jgi:putative ABC transport system substrate-binding protein
VAWPLAARAQQDAVPEIGFLTLLDRPPDDLATAAFRRGLGEQGYVEGRNRNPVSLWGIPKRSLAGVGCGPRPPSRRGHFVNFTPAALAARKTTATIPIVFALGSDPVQAGLVASLNRPGGNVTGTAYLLLVLPSV